MTTKKELTSAEVRAKYKEFLFPSTATYYQESVVLESGKGSRLTDLDRALSLLIPFRRRERLGTALRAPSRSLPPGRVGLDREIDILSQIGGRQRQFQCIELRNDNPHHSAGLIEKRATAVPSPAPGSRCR